MKGGNMALTIMDLKFRNPLFELISSAFSILIYSCVEKEFSIIRNY